MKWIEININFKLTKIGHKVRTFEELVKLNPQFILDAIDKDNRIILLDDCISLLNEASINEEGNKKVSKEKLRIIKIILERNKYRQERLAAENAEKIAYTDSDNISMGNGITLTDFRFCGIKYGL